MIDEDGKLRAYLGGPRFNDSVTLVDENGVERASLRVLAEGTSVLSMADDAGRGRAAIHVNRQGNATLQFYDENGRVSGVFAGTSSIP